MSVFIIKVERKARPKGWADAPRGSVAGFAAHVLTGEAPLYLAELQLRSTSGAECQCGAAVQQLARVHPRWWYLRNQLSNCSAMCCLGFAKFHHDPGRLSHLPGLPELGGRSYHPVLEKSGLGVPREATGCVGLGVEEESYICREAPFPFLRGSKTYDLLHGHVPVTGLPVFQVSLVVFFLFPFII